MEFHAEADEENWAAPIAPVTSCTKIQRSPGIQLVAAVEVFNRSLWLGDPIDEKFEGLPEEEVVIAEGDGPGWLEENHSVRRCEL